MVPGNHQGAGRTLLDCRNRENGGVQVREEVGSKAEREITQKHVHSCGHGVKKYTSTKANNNGQDPKQFLGCEDAHRV